MQTTTKKKEGKKYKGQNKLSPTNLEKYWKEKFCFRCGEKGHKLCQEDSRNSTSRHFLSSHDNDVLSSSQLLYTWGRIRDQSAFTLLDVCSTHNFILVDLAQCLVINAEEMVPPLQALGAFEGQQVLVTPLIGKLHFHIQNFFNSKDFYVSPIVNQDVILEAPWFHHLYAKIQFQEKVVSFTHYGREYSIKAQNKGNAIPLVNSSLR